MKKTKKFYETKDFKNLQKQWYATLKKKGFVDIEDGKENKVCISQEFLPRQDHVDYFKKCEELLHSGLIKDKLDLFILEKHCEGKGLRETEILLVKEKLKKITNQAISLRLNKILKIGGIAQLDFG